MDANRTTGDRLAPQVKRGMRAFTLIEMLVVLAIIGVILALSLPHFRGMNEGRAMEAAARQLMDDLAFARQSAIATRSTVAMVFLSPAVMGLNATAIGGSDTNLVQTVKNLQGGGLTTYALFAYRQTGEQPGRYSRRYLTEWKTLPDKVFIAEEMFANQPDALPVSLFPFPIATAQTNPFAYIAFTPQGQCLPVVSPLTGLTDKSLAEDIHLRLAAGSILYTRDAVGDVQGWSVQEVPPGNSVTLSNVIRVDWLTGRAKLERAELTRQ